MKHTSTLLLSFLFVAVLHAQPQRCSTTEYMAEQMLLDPAWSERLQTIERHYEQYISQPQAQRSVITIPVVVHVVYNTAQQNISDALVQAQIDQLNQDFARLNTDAANTPPAFAALAANTSIQFCLAQRDPAGNATSGIVRRQTTVTSFGTNNNVKRTANGGSDAWPAASYLNIWVCNLGSSLLGYAQFPGGAAATDGVVVLWSSVGSLAYPGTLSPYNYGRTATHEVGHWLNLFHIWGDDSNRNGVCNVRNECAGSDNVQDTPNQGEENYGCPAFPRTDCCAPSGPGVMFMNYMDYTADGCMNMFTQGQSARMNALFAAGGARASLLYSQGCLPASGGGDVCAVPAGLHATSVTSSGATLNWGGVYGATYVVRYRAAGAALWIEVAAATNNYGLTGLQASTAYEWQVKSLCSGLESDFSGTASFSTPGVLVCSDIYEPNNSLSNAKPIATNTVLSAFISAKNDVDYYSFTTTGSNTNLLISMTNLPADYDMKLYGPTGAQLAVSENPGTNSESIVYNASAAGTYYLYIYGWRNASNASKCYVFQVAASSLRMEESEGHLTVGKPTAEHHMNLYPNPANNLLQIKVDAGEEVMVSVYSLTGQKLWNQRFSEVESNSIEIQTSGMANGVYILEARGGNWTGRQRFSVQH